MSEYAGQTNSLSDYIDQVRRLHAFTADPNALAAAYPAANTANPLTIWARTDDNAPQSTPGHTPITWIADTLRRIFGGGGQPGSRGGQQGIIGSDGRRYVNAPPGQTSADYLRQWQVNPQYNLPSDFFNAGMKDGKFDWETFVRAHADSPYYPGLKAHTQFNMTTPDGRSVPVVRFEGYDPTHGTWDLWKEKILGTPSGRGDQSNFSPGTPPYGGYTTPPPENMKVAWGQATPYLQTDSATGLPFTDPGPWSAASSSFMGGPQRAPYPPGQVFNDPTNGTGVLSPGAGGLYPYVDTEPARVPVMPPLRQQ